MTNNLYAIDPKECTKWAFIDCNGYVRHDVIRAICQQLHIAIVHVSHHDYVLFIVVQLSPELFNCCSIVILYHCAD